MRAEIQANAVVLDTNVLASGVLSRASTPGQILTAWTFDRFERLISEPILTELARTLGKPNFRQRLTSTQIVSVFELLRHEASLVTVSIDVRGRATHPEDDAILATALSGKSDYLVTADIQLQQLDQFEGVNIRSPLAFLDDLRSTSN